MVPIIVIGNAFEMTYYLSIIQEGAGSVMHQQRIITASRGSRVHLLKTYNKTWNIISVFVCSSTFPAGRERQFEAQIQRPPSMHSYFILSTVLSVSVFMTSVMKHAALYITGWLIFEIIHQVIPILKKRAGKISLFIFMWTWSPDQQCLVVGSLPGWFSTLWVTSSVFLTCRPCWRMFCVSGEYWQLHRGSVANRGGNY